MRTLIFACMASCLAVCAGAQPASESTSATASTGRSGAPADGIPIAQLIAAVAKSSGRRFVLDPRVRATVSLVGISPSSVSYSELLTILSVHGFVAGEQDGLMLVLPDANARTMPTQPLTERQTRPDSEIVTDTMLVKNAPAALFVPIIRPLMPQSAHFAADICNNTLVIVDRFANVKRIEALVRRMDVGEPFKSHCDGRESPTSPREAAPVGNREPASPPREATPPPGR